MTAVPPRLDAAYCPACMRRLRRGTHRPCSGCGYVTGGLRNCAWRPLREFLVGAPWGDMILLGANDRLNVAEWYAPLAGALVPI